MMEQNTFRIEWEAYEYEHRQRTQDWFWAVGIMSISAAIAAIILNNIILGILILVGTFSLLIFANRPPNKLHVVIDEKGVTRGRIHYPFATLASFWITPRGSRREIILRSEKMLMPLITIPVGEDVDTEELHEVLSHFLQEEHLQIPVLERLLDLLGF